MQFFYQGQEILAAYGGSGGGITVHRDLSGREEAAQHPISAIEGLEEALSRIPDSMEALTNEELEELLK